jgi:hypothetical protein
MNIHPYLKKPKVKLCVGPMTINTIESVNKFSKKHKKYIYLICSKNQIESKKLGGGYVNNFSTESFAKYIKKLNNSFIKLGRDHGGPFIADKKSKNMKKEIVNCKSSFTSDIKSGFELLHIDTSFAKKEKFKLALELYNYCYKKSKKYNKNIHYEIGVNFHGDKFIKQEFNQIIKNFSNLQKIKFVTGTTGSKINNSKQVGNFNKKNSKLMTKELSKKGILVKDHNCDFLKKREINLRKKCGIYSFNIGPELAHAENEILYDIGIKSKNKFFSKFLITVLKSEKWKKWCNKNSSNKNKFSSSAHYLYNNINYINFKKLFLSSANFDSLVIKKHFDIYSKFF